MDNPLRDANRLRALVITRAERSVLIGTKSGVRECPVPTLDPQVIRDTNGAGDAFVGGFLAQHCQGAELATSVRCGIWAASYIIQQSGCTFDEKLKFK